jgi:hypothetical protein
MGFDSPRILAVNVPKSEKRTSPNESFPNATDSGSCDGLCTFVGFYPKSDWAEKLEEAIQFGSTGTEILMALRWHLQQFKLQGEKCAPATELLIEELLRKLNHH